MLPEEGCRRRPFGLRAPGVSLSMTEPDPQTRAEATSGPDELRYEDFRYNPNATIVLLPGVFAGGWIWDDTWTCLRRNRFSVLRLLDAFAVSDRASESIEAARATVKALLDRVAPARYVLCGNSLGGLIALDFVRHHPDRVEALVVSGAPGLRPEADLGLGTPRQVTTEHVVQLAHKLFYDPKRVTPDMVQRVHAVLSQRRHVVNLFRALRAARDYDMDATRCHVSCPALLVWGANDCVTPPAPWREAARGLREGEFHTIPKCGHSPMVERPHEFNRLLLDFLRRKLIGRAQAA